MRCTVLGGGGFIGAHLSLRLHTEGHDVTVIEHPALAQEKTILANVPVRWEPVDFTDAVALEAALAGCEVLFHLVSTTVPQSSNDNPLYDLETNTEATLRLLEAAKHQGVKKIIFTSSGGTVYGIPQTSPIHEDHPTEPHCAYGISKLSIEKYLHLYEFLHGIEYCILRIANPYGEGQSPFKKQGVIAVFLHKALTGQPLEIWGEGEVVRDYIYIGDVTDAFLAALHYAGDQRVFNIGSGEGHSLNDIMLTMEHVIGQPVAKRFIPGRGFDVPANVLAISRAHTHLGWQPATSLAAGIKKAMDWQRATFPC